MELPPSLGTISNNPNTVRRRKILEIPDPKRQRLAILCWVMETFNEVKPKLLPTPPHSYRQYETAEPAMKQKIRYSRTFWMRRDIKNYLDQRESVINYNEAQIHHLAEYLTWIDETHEYYETIKNRLNDFMAARAGYRKYMNNVKRQEAEEPRYDRRNDREEVPAVNWED